MKENNMLTFTVKYFFYTYQVNNLAILHFNLKFCWKQVYTFLASVPLGENFFLVAVEKWRITEQGTEWVLRGSWKLTRRPRQLVLHHSLPLFLP